MRPIYVRAFVLILCSLTAITTSVGAQRHANPPLPLPGLPSAMGVNIHFNDPRPGEMEQLAAAGFRWIRQDFAWAGIEREKGRYDFSEYERLLAALKPYHIRPIFILDYGNDLYEQGSPRNPEARAAFARFAAAAVVHFKNRGILWEMWNEPNGGFWSPRANVDEYIALALATGKAIREAAPDEWYIGPGVSGMDFGFMERCFQAGLLQYWDVVSFHPYRNTPPETAAADYRRLREIIARYAPPGKTVPILSSEWGYSELYPSLNPEKQTRYIVRETLTNLMNGLLVSIWYDWHDDGTDPKETEHHFGTVYNDYRPKPTYTAAQTLATQLQGFHYNKRLALDSPDDYCLLFTNDTQQRLIVWTTNAMPHDVKLPASQGDFQIIDLLGKQGAAHAGTQGLTLTLTEAPQYLIPQGRNTLLALATAWHTAPTTVYTDNKLELVRISLPPSVGFGLLPPPPSERGTVTLHGVSRPGALPVAALQQIMGKTGETRDERPLIVRATLHMQGGGEVSQEFELRPSHPLRVTPLPAVGATVPVRVENPTGAAFSGRIGLTHASQPAMLLPLRFAVGERAKTVELPLKGESNGEAGRGYTVACVVQERDRGTWSTVVTTPTLRYIPFETFAAYPSGATLPASTYQVVPDGDPKVKSEITSTVVEAPAGLPGGMGHALQIAYRFDPGWKFLRLARTAELPGTPEALGMWIYGDGSGDLLRARFNDATGQTFQADGGNLDWKGWRYVSFPLSGDIGGHWGGANDGTIHYPIRLDTPLLVDTPQTMGSKGVVYVTDITLIGRD
jgi:polysaccharide biosynthesis protein PslG